MPWGEVLAEQKAAEFSTPYQFNGKELDQETGLYNYGARYYDPSLSVWLGVDPLADQFPGWSPYNYTMNNPINMIDPDGRAPENIIISSKMVNGRRKMTITMNAVLLNLSSSKKVLGRDINSFRKSIVGKANEAFSGHTVLTRRVLRESGLVGEEHDNIDISFKLNLKLISDMSEIGSDDHVLAIIDNIPDNDKAGVAYLGENAALVEQAPYNDPVHTAVHEIGHLLGLDHTEKNTLMLGKPYGGPSDNFNVGKTEKRDAFGFYKDGTHLNFFRRVINPTQNLKDLLGSEGVDY